MVDIKVDDIEEKRRKYPVTIAGLFDFSLTVRYTVDDARRSCYKLSLIYIFPQLLLCLTGSK
jgi:hypothetical protein